MTERVSTGIDSLDELIEGGILKGSTVLVSGSAGIGKTIFSSQFLWEGVQNGETCLFITLEEDEADILGDAREFGWDFEKEDNFYIEYINPFTEDFTFDSNIKSFINEYEPDRVVIDPVSMIGMGLDSGAPGEVRKELYEIIKQMSGEEVTTLMTTEKPDPDNLTRYGVEEYVVDGVFIMKGLGFGGDMGRKLSIQKMRRTNFEHEVYPVEIGEDGIEVKEPEKGLSL
ncbi:MAG: RAD55 family ATPase [Candidatus Nanohalobium sp.]